jgi:hypothetical protein
MSAPLQLEPLEIVLGANFPVPLRLTRPSQASGDRFRPIADTGRNLVAFLSLDRSQSAVAIHGTLSIALTEMGTDGSYYGDFAGAHLTTHLLPYADTETPVYLIVAEGTTVRACLECRVRSWQSMLVLGGRS